MEGATAANIIVSSKLLWAVLVPLLGSFGVMLVGKKRRSVVERGLTRLAYGQEP